MSSSTRTGESVFLVTPDALVRHLGAPIVARVRQAGFQPVAHRLLWTPPAGIDDFHRRHDTVAADPELHRLANALFELGPSLALLLTHPDVPDQSSMFDRLRELKGRGEPAHAAKGSLRHDFGAINTILNLVHATGSTEETAREKEIFLTGGQPESHPGGEVSTTLAMVEHVLPKETRSFDALLGGVRQRVLAALWDEVPPTGRRRVLGWLERGPLWLARARLGEGLAEDLGPGHPLLQVLDTDFGPDSGVRWDELHKVITAGGVTLDRWEQLVLSTSLRFRSRRSTEQD